MIQPFAKAKQLLLTIENAGYEAYFVGGSVRDFLLGRPIEDVDIATSATPEEIKTIFPRTADVGIEHGTVLVFFNGDSYEITTFRAEAEYRDFRRPSHVDYIRSLKEDLQRRDFTMNAIAMDRHGKLIDPFDGRSAINRKRIETVGNASERFSEDALRMMRAVRFVSQLSFTLAPATKEALHIYGHLLEKIATERKTAEFEKLIAGLNRQEAISLIIDSGLYRFLPGLSGCKKALEKMNEYDYSSLSGNELWCLLLYCCDISAEEIDPFLRKWKLPVKKIKEIEKIYRFLKFRLEQEWTSLAAYQAGIAVIISAERIWLTLKGVQDDSRLAQLRLEYERLPIKSRTDIKASGNDLIEWTGKPGGPWVKEIFTKIEAAIVAGDLHNDQENLREWVGKCSRN
ncbi:CCA tRNA nucleotidyltransferase [Bacillus canaveralius]|uniref:CCA-adding enzyme n=1 Tax=Bacillus canaveralius TaxID=1403243 RepID=A0A2N5GHZ1_9BACI|nr:CCA tRNA nucleotidyltransferase [Bacillus canaveralius]PLR80464.1 CCA tRNA nucleotidyltransferase [Bacillus canaveralius]PLS00671.1 CCA tRNA nucleotidyltransferase [Bacillus canaveralius]